ncbi:MAG: glycosyltransferase [Deltaproteobacteria bacterium]|nr:glycosyltransferase [Deltaproteobacteria bacterium]
MTTPPFFSVVIPTYNCAGLLERALSTVLEQTDQDFEIIVVDNSSTDHTSRVLGAIDDPRLSVFKVNNHGVIAYSRNIGIRKSRGKWIAFLDSDDVWLPEKLESVHSAILENQDAVLICHDERKVVDGKAGKILRHVPSKPDVYESLLFCGNCLSPSAVTLRKDVALSTGGFSERKDFITVEDYEYWIRLSKAGAFYFINKILGEWHVHGKNISSNAEIHAKAYIRVCEYHLGLWLKENPESKNRVRRGKSRICSVAAHALLNGRMFSKAFGYSQKALSLSPFNWKAWAVLLLSVMRISA